MSGPQITVIIPAYNVADFILPCLRSVTSQTMQHWRAIVIDDGSTDATAAQVRMLDDPRVTLVQQANAGVSAARNNGLAMATGRYLMFLDGDDVLHPEAFARLSAALDARPVAVASFGTFTKILPSGAPYPGQKPLARHVYPDGDVLEAMLRGNFLANGGHVLIRTGDARALGGFDPGIRLSEDWEFWCRLAARGNSPSSAMSRRCSHCVSGQAAPRVVFRSTGRIISPALMPLPATPRSRRASPQRNGGG